MIKCFRDRAEFVLPGPQQRDDDRPVHARVHRAAGEDLPPARRARDGRHGGVHPRRTDEEANERRQDKVARGQGARGRRRLRRHLGRPPRLGRGARWSSSTRVLGDKPNQVDRQRDDVEVERRRAARRHVHARATITEEGLRNDVNVGIQYISSWLRGNGAAGDLRADGGRRHGGDRALAGVAVAAPRRRARRRREGHRRAGAAARDRGAREDPRARSATTSGSRREGRPTESRELFEQVALGGRLPRVPDAAGVRLSDRDDRTGTAVRGVGGGARGLRTADLRTADRASRSAGPGRPTTPAPHPPPAPSGRPRRRPNGATCRTPTPACGLREAACRRPVRVVCPRIAGRRRPAGRCLFIASSSRRMARVCSSAASSPDVVRVAMFLPLRSGTLPFGGNVTPRSRASEYPTWRSSSFVPASLTLGEVEQPDRRTRRARWCRPPRGTPRRPGGSGWPPRRPACPRASARRAGPRR